KAGDVAIVHGLGYDDADLSHFGSFASWSSAKGGTGGGGWLGEYLDGPVGFDDPLAAIGIGQGLSPALLGQGSFAANIADSTGLQPRLPAWVDDADGLLQAWSDFEPAKIDTKHLVGQVERAVRLTATARRDLDRALAGVRASTRETPTMAAQRRQYQDASVIDSLSLAAELVKSDAKPRVIYVNGIGDFDTHQGEADRHPVLMQQLDDGIEALFNGLGKHADKVVLATVSEFG